MPLSPELVVWLVRQGHDASHALEAGLDRASDEVIMERARNEQHVVVTADNTTKILIKMNLYGLGRMITSQKKFIDIGYYFC